jgi:Bacterial SH3 domain
MRQIRSLLVFMMLSALLVGTTQTSRVQAQSDVDSELLIQTNLGESEYPVAPAFVRLLRINLTSGASSPLHTHPGPELGLVEQGILTVEVNGPARISEPGADVGQGTPVAGAEASTNADFELTTGEQILYLPQTPMTFRNADEGPLSILSVVILPAGNQHPPGITYLNGQPEANAFEGVSPEILGDGVATVLPAGGIDLTVDRIRLAPNQAIPASDSTVLYSLERGTMDFTVVSGKVQVSRTSSPGPQPDTAPGTDVSLSKGDAVFFPIGSKEVSREGSDSELVLLRMTLAPGGGVSPTPAAEGVGEISIINSSGTSVASPAASPDASTGAATPVATATKAPNEIQTGATVVANSDGVNIRSGAGIDYEIVTQVFTGDEMEITGPSEDADDYTWWPVALVNDPSVTGYIVEEFIDLVE